MKSYFKMHFEEEGEEIKFKARKVREKLWEPIYVDETEVVANGTSGIKQITIKSMSMIINIDIIFFNIIFFLLQNI